MVYSNGDAVKIFLACTSPGIHAVWPNREKRCVWTITESCGWLVVNTVIYFFNWQNSASVFEEKKSQRKD